MVGTRRLGQRQQRSHHPLHLLLAGGARAAHGALDLLGRVGTCTARPRWPAASITAPRAWPTANARAHVGAEVQLLDRHRRRGRCSSSSCADPRVDVDQACARAAGPSRGRDHAAVERQQSRAARLHHAVAGAGGAGIDAQDDHPAGFCAPARMPPAGARLRPAVPDAWMASGNSRSPADTADRTQMRGRAERDDLSRNVWPQPRRKVAELELVSCAPDAERDAVTGLASLARLRTALEIECDRARRQGRPLSRRGARRRRLSQRQRPLGARRRRRGAADRRRRAAARLVRTHDLVARTGGDEFTRADARDRAGRRRGAAVSA